MILKFDKRFKNNKYEILFNTHTGVEITRGIHGHDDPFVMEMPSLLDIGIMGTCKNKCAFCYQGHVNRPNMLLSDFKKIIDETSYHVNQVALGGRGDPNHHEHFGEIIEYCRMKNVVPNYTTSGIGITNEQIEISKMCGAVAVSEIFSEQKTVNDSTLTVRENTYEVIETFIDAEIKTNIHFIYSKVTHNRAIDILKGNDVWNGKVNIEKLNAIIFLLFKPHGAGKLLDWCPSQDQIKHFASVIFNPRSKFKVGMDSCLVNHTSTCGNPSKIQMASIDTCEAARMSAYITSDMKFMPCSFADERVFSIPITKGLKTIWSKGEPFQTFRTQLTHNRNSCPLEL